MSLLSTAITLAERGFVPTPAVRRGIRSIVGRRYRQQHTLARPVDAWIAEMGRSAVALATADANAQHYEVPPAFFALVLGPHMKYSGAWWPEGVTTLGEAERAMLDATMSHAALADGQRILELGCGWGSLTLAMAHRFPHARIVGVSNSSRQREHILARARAQGLANVDILTVDMNTFQAPGRFDRVVSVEMFEHMRNWPELVRRIHGWLDPDGALFVHVFAHLRFAYPYDVEGDDDWMARHFFTGGMMPSDDLLPRVATGLFAPEGHWRYNGTHYARTAEAWHDLLVTRREDVQRVLIDEFGRVEGLRAYHRWKIFFLACAELFGYRNGSEWIVSHYLLRRMAAEPRA
jgi:cyclopropane-fatty-acyl-phospholipid synthase